MQQLNDAEVSAAGTTAVGGVIYDYANAAPSHTSRYLWPTLDKVIGSDWPYERRAFEIGCGNGATARMLLRYGFSATGIDPSESGVEIAKANVDGARFHIASTADNLSDRFGTYPLVVSFEVLGFVLDSTLFAQRVMQLLEPGGVAVISTPYHGYLKNLTISLTNGWDRHLDPFWCGTQVRFFSKRTFTRLWHEAGVQKIKIVRVGRVPPVAKAMIGIIYKSR